MEKRFVGLMIRSGLFVFLSAAAIVTGCATAGVNAGKYIVYFGTYSSGENGGIFRSTLDMGTGSLSQPVLAGRSVNPSFVAIHPDGKYLYSVGELGGADGRNKGAVSAWEIDGTSGDLKPLNSQPSMGDHPCHIIVDDKGCNVLVANYSSGSCAVLPLGKDGTLQPASSCQQYKGSSIHPARQKAAYAHSINLDPGGKFAVVADLGIDKVMIYAYDSESGKLTPGEQAFASVKPGSGPRHFVFHTSGKFAYVNNELSSTVTAFKYDGGKGALSEIQMISTLPEDFKGNNTTAEIRVTPDGRFLYVSNRGHDSIAMYAIDGKTGLLALVGFEPSRGKTPRNINIDPAGKYLLAAHQDSDNVTVFRIDPATGRLEFTGTEVKLPKPVCIRFLTM